MSKIYALDIGNSSIKGTLIEEGRALESVSFDTLGRALAWPSGLSGEVEALVYCSVRRPSAEADELFRQWHSLTGRDVLRITADMSLPIGVRYAPASSLGADRIAAAVGAWDKAWRPWLVVDAGTALTIDLVADYEFQGGTISPGIRMRFESLGHDTQLLPEVSPEGDLPVRGNSTATAIRAGVIRGAAAEIEVAFRQAVSKYPGLCMVLTGGDAPVLGNVLRERGLEFELDPLLVFRGLESSYRYIKEAGDGLGSFPDGRLDYPGAANASSGRKLTD